jgi:hypothetical protein
MEPLFNDVKNERKLLALNLFVAINSNGSKMLSIIN